VSGPANYIRYMRHIAIIGSGPAGCYLADQLLRLIPGVSIDVLEKLPVPFGLIRYGVAPDHQSTKAVARLFDRVLARDQVSFFGNVEVGRDVRLDELMTLYDAVVLATGAARDRRLGIPGEDLPGVVGSGSFVGWYNGHPHAQAPVTSEVRSAVVIGNGNVAIDVARILAKGPEEFAGSDVGGQVAAWLTAQPLETIHVVGRRGAAEAKFVDHELAELGTLLRARPVVSDPASLTGETAVVNTLRGFAESSGRNAPVTIHFDFNLTPTAFVGDGKLQEVQFRSASGQTVSLPAQLAVTCIGYEALPCCAAVPANGVFANEDGKVDERLYVVGWAKRGPSGTIPTNRVEAQQLAQKIAEETHKGEGAGGAGLRKLLKERNIRRVDYLGWRRIDLVEVARATAGRCREKFCKPDEMLDTALST
jgi:NADPH-dependent glutamate synthase beta subunit-like oxidoreductase